MISPNLSEMVPVKLNGILYEKYLASRDGQLWSLFAKKFLKLYKSDYYQCALRNNGKGKTLIVHRLIAEAFIPNPLNLPQVNHKNGDKYDNRVENLEWCTSSENSKHAIATGLQKVRTRAVIQFSLKGEQLAEFESIKAAGLATGVCVKSISSVCAGRKNKCYGFRWAYKEKTLKSIPKNPRLKKVDQIDPKTGATVKTHESVLAAADSIGRSRSYMSTCCVNPDFILDGYIWKFSQLAEVLIEEPCEKIIEEEREQIFFKDIELAGYFITRSGEVWSQKSKTYRKQYIKKGYYTIGFLHNKKSYTLKTHRIIAIAYIPNPLNLKMVNHKNGNKLDNSIENLEWCTAKENSQHACDTGLTKPATSPVVQFSLSGEKIADYNSIIQASKKLNIDRHRIGHVCNGKFYMAGNYRWSYKGEEDKIPLKRGSCKDVCQVDPDTNDLIATYECVKEASKSTNYNERKLYEARKNDAIYEGFLWISVKNMVY